MFKAKEFPNEIKLILNCAKNIGNNHDRLELKQLVSKSLNWHFIISEAFYHGVPSFIYRKLNRPYLTGGIPQKYLSLLKDYYKYTLLKNNLLWNEFYSIYNVLNQAKIKAIPIKGINLLNFVYYDFGLRPMVDIDILIQRSDLLPVEKLLSRLGYHKNTKYYSRDYYEKYNFQIPFVKVNSKDEPICCEVHWGIASPRPNRIILSEFWNDIRIETIKGRKLLLLSPENTLFSLILHLRRYNRPFSLKYIYDVYKILNKFKDNFNWDYLIRESKENRLKSILFFVLFSAHKFFEAPLPSPILKELNPGIVRTKPMLDIISRYTFSPDIIKHSDKRKYLYVFLRFLLYDKVIDFLSFILFIPREEFARFYSLQINSKKTILSYRFRIIYILYHLCLNIVKAIINKFKSIFKL